MKLLSLREVIEAIASCANDEDVYRRYGWVHVHEDDGDDGEGPILARRFFISTKGDKEPELMNESGDRSAFAVEHHLFPYLEAATFAAVLVAQKAQKPLSDEADYARALEYYDRRDAFLDLSGSGRRRRTGRAEHLYREYDLTLEHCPAERAGDAARAVYALLGLPLPEALALCRQPPVKLGQRIDANACEKIESRFASLSLPLVRRTYHVSRGLYREYDLTLEHCPAERAGDAARAVSALLGLPLREALALCRQPPVKLGQRIDANAREKIENRFASLSLLVRRTYHGPAWLQPDSGAS